MGIAAFPSSVSIVNLKIMIYLARVVLALLLKLSIRGERFSSISQEESK